MILKNIFKLLSMLLLVPGCTTEQTEQHPNRLHFFQDEDRAILVPVTINDSVTAITLFDTGASNTRVQLDSTFCAEHPLPAWENPIASTKGYLTGWAKKEDPKVTRTTYKQPLTINMCSVDMEFDSFYTQDNSNCVGKFEACFSFSAKDTTHIWELNFEKNYMEPHPSQDFTMPENCRVFPLIAIGHWDMGVRFPMTVTCENGDTISVDQEYLIDTGMLSDLALTEASQAYPFFDKREDVVLVRNNRNNKRYNVSAEVFDGVRVDDMRIYLNDGSFMLTNTGVKGIIGLNFLKRFNVFFDLSKRQIGFQPIKGFKRTVNYNAGRLYIDTQPTPDGKTSTVTKVWDVPDNPYREAGMQIGDIITAVNGVKLQDSTRKNTEPIHRSKTRTMDIIRAGKQMTLTVHLKELGE